MAALVIAAWLALPGAFQAAIPELLIGVVYSAPASVPDAVIAADFRDMRRAGYNTVVVEDPKARDRMGAAAIAERLPIIDGLPAEAVRIPVGPGASGVGQARLAFWRAIAAGARHVVFEAPGRRLTQEIRALGETAGTVSRNQSLFMPMRPRKGGVASIAGDRSPELDVALMESPEALMIIATNAGAAPRSVKVTFEAVIPEAMWLDMESGTSIDFVMSADGPVFEHTFGPREALVLMIRKRFRSSPR